MASYFTITPSLDPAQGAPEAVAPGPRAEAPAAQGVLPPARRAQCACAAASAQAGGLLRLGGLGQRRPHPGTIHKGRPHQS